ncbi:MAG TPA: hypothetical protein VF756_11930 [Thermoanaerobaculia bacterium]
MSCEPVLAVVRPSHRHIALLTAAVLGGLLLGGTAEAKTSGRIVAAEMSVDRCEDFFGTCEWRLTCKVGNAADTELLPSAEVGVAGKVEIAKTFESVSFPVNVACTLAEDDGWFGASWEEVATASLAIPGGGDYSLDLGNDAQGAVRVSFTIDSLEVAAAPVASRASSKKAASKEARQYLGVYGEKPEGHAVVMGLPWDAFKARVDQFAAAGPKLVYLQTWDDGGQLLWAGIFRTMKEKQQIVTGLDWDAFIAEYKKQSEQGMVLADLEIYGKSVKDYRFAGVFHEGAEQNPVWIGQSREEILGKVMELSGKGMRLVDMEAYKAGDRVLYTAVFRPGHGSYGLWTELDWDAFTSKAKGTSSSAVTKIATYTVGGKRLYDGVIRGGSAHEIEPALEASAFATRWKEQLDEGIRLVSFETWP